MAPHAESPPNGWSGSAYSSSPSSIAGDVTDAQMASMLRRAGFSDQAPRPNILYIMADQMSAPLLKMHDAESVIKTPHLDKLAEKGVVFDNAYCKSLLCSVAKSRGQVICPFFFLLMLRGCLGCRAQISGGEKRMSKLHAVPSSRYRRCICSSPPPTVAPAKGALTAFGL